MERRLEISRQEILANLETAKERLKSSKILLDANQYRDSISRSYYAFLDSAMAALLSKEIFVKSHSGVYKMFALHLIKPGLIEQKYGRWLNLAFRSRLEADYEKQKVFTLDNAEEALREAQEFVERIERFINKEN